MPHELDSLDVILSQVRRTLIEQARRPLVLGLCGAQGSGKSTLAMRLAEQCDREGIVTAILSLDDLYHPRAIRERLAREVHPLLMTRGVPGTHDVDLGLAIFAAFDAGRAVALPRFDKAADDRCPVSEWQHAPAETQLLILEGWCVGARPEAEAQLVEPLNRLERDEDPAGIWRRYASSALAGDYQRLWARLDCLVLVAAPAFDAVFRWRLEQEHALIARTGRGMSDSEVAGFILHYERLTRHILAEMPGRADLTIAIDQDRRPVSVRWADRQPLGQ